MLTALTEQVYQALSNDPDTSPAREKLEDALRNDEGRRRSIYLDTLGNATAGIGHLLTPDDPESALPVGARVPKQRVDQWFEQDVSRAIDDARRVFPNYDELPEEAQVVIGSMAFQLGGKGLSGFRNFRGAVEQGDWDTAIAEMHRSEWARQTPNRVKKHASRLRRIAPVAADTPRSRAMAAVLNRETTATPQAGIRVADAGEAPVMYAEGPESVATDAAPDDRGLVDRAYDWLTKASEELDAPAPATLDDLLKTPAKSIIPFLVHHGLASVPHIAAATLSMPAYAAAIAGGIGRERAMNDAREKMTVEDLLVSVGPAAAIATLERFGAKGMIFGSGKTARSLKDVGREAGASAVREGVLTEAPQSAIEYAAATVGTKEGADLRQALRAVAEGTIAGTGIGGAVGGTRAAVEATAQQQPEPEPEPQPEPAVAAEEQWTQTDEAELIAELDALMADVDQIDYAPAAQDAETAMEAPGTAVEAPRAAAAVEGPRPPANVAPEPISAPVSEDYLRENLQQAASAYFDGETITSRPEPALTNEVVDAVVREAQGVTPPTDFSGEAQPLAEHLRSVAREIQELEPAPEVESATRFVVPPELDDIQFRAGRRNVGDRKPEYDPDVPVTGKPVSRETAIRDLTSALDFKVYTGRMGRIGKTATGFFVAKTGELRLRNHGDMETLIHEAGHMLDARFPDISKAWLTNPAFQAELREVSYDADNIKEGFAEFMRLWATQPDVAAEAAPEFSQWWENWLDGHPKEGAALRQFRRTALDWFGQSAEDRLQSKISGSIPVNEKMGVGAVLKEHLADYRQMLTDDLHGIAEMERDLRGQRGEVYETARLIRGAAGVVIGALEHGAPVRLKNGDIVYRGDSLTDVLKPVSDDLDGFFKYAVALSASELKAQGRERLFRDDEIAAGLALETPTRVAAFENYRDWNNKVVDFAQSMGIVDPDARAKWRRQFYLPFYRVMNIITGKETSALGEFRGIQTLWGGTQNLHPIMETIVKNANMLITAAVKNEAQVKIADLSMKSNGAKYMAHVEGESRPMQVARNDIVKIAAKALAPDQALLTAEQQDVLGEIASGLESMVEIWRQNLTPKGDNFLAVMRNGKPEFYEVIDPLLLRSLKAFSRPPKNRMIAAASAVKDLTREAVTLSPDFMIRNVVRDTLTAWVFSRHGMVPFVDSARGLVSRLKKDSDYQDFLANGGGFATINMDDANARARIESFTARKGIAGRTLLAGRKGWQGLLKFAEAFELAARLGEYKKARKRGFSRREAAYAGREISTDFAMRGDGTFVGGMYDTILFFKAAVNSFDRLARGVASDPHRKAIAAKAALVSLVSAGLWALNQGNPLYDELADWDKDGYWHFFVPNSEYFKRRKANPDYEPADTEEASVLYTHFSLPKIWEIGAMASITERAMEAQFGTPKTRTPEAMARIVQHTLGLELWPSVLKPGIEVAFNKSFFTDRPIEDQNMQRLAPELRAKPWTSELAKKSAQIVPLSPVQIDHLLRGYLGYWGSYAQMMVDEGFDTPQKRLDQLPMVRSFLRQHPRQSVYQDQLWERWALSREAMMSMKEAVKRGDIETAEEYQAKPETAEYSLMHRASGIMSNLNKIGAAAYQSRDIDRVRQIAEQLMDEGVIPEKTYDRHKDNIRALKRYIRDGITVLQNRLSRQTHEVLEEHRANSP